MALLLQPEAHEDGLHAEDALEGCDDGDTTATTYRQRALSEGYCDSLFGCLIGGQVDGAEVGFAAVHRRDLDADVLWSDALDVVDEGLTDLVVVLVSYEAARDLSIGLRGKDGLRAFALIATPDAADVEGRTAAITLKRVVADFAEEVIDVEELLVLLFAEGDLRDHRALFIREGHDVIVEVWDGDTPVLVLDLSDELTELVDGVSDSTAEVAGVQVVVGTRDLDLPVGQTAQARGERGVSALTILVSETMMFSARSISRCSRQNCSRCVEPISSSPSRRNFTLHSTRPRARAVSKPLIWIID